MYCQNADHMVPVLDILDLLTTCDPCRRKTVCQTSLSILIGLNWGRAVGRQTHRKGCKYGLPKLPTMTYFLLWQFRSYCFLLLRATWSRHWVARLKTARKTK